MLSGLTATPVSALIERFLNKRPDAYIKPDVLRQDLKERTDKIAHAASVVSGLGVTIDVAIYAPSNVDAVN